MGCGPWECKESDTNERLTLSLSSFNPSLILPVCLPAAVASYVLTINFVSCYYLCITPGLQDSKDMAPPNFKTMVQT